MFQKNETIVEGQRLFQPNIMESVRRANRSLHLGFVSVSLSVSLSLSLCLCLCVLRVVCCGGGGGREGGRRGEGERHIELVADSKQSFPQDC